MSAHPAPAQSAFAFDTEISLSPSLEHPPGTYCDPVMTIAEMREYLAEARTRLVTALPRLQPAYTIGIECAERELALIEKRPDSRPERRCLMPPLRLQATEEWREWFSTALAPDPTVEVRTRTTHFYYYKACHTPGVGSLIVRAWPKVREVLFYFPGRSSALHASHLDDAPRIALSARVWEPAYAAQHIAESPNAPARVPCFGYQGRWYVTTQVVSTRVCCEGKAWRLTPAIDWKHETLNYTTLTGAWDRGSIERGNDRGLLVRARQQLFVLDGCVHFYDEHPPILNAPQQPGTAEVPP